MSQELEKAVAKEIIFPEGLVGCEEWKNFLLVETEESGPFRLLQCLDEEDISFYVADPYLVIEDYQVSVPRAVCEHIGLSDWQDGMLLCILVVQEEPLSVMANLLGPLLINAANGKGVQLVLSGSGYSSRHIVIAPSGAEQC